MNALDGLLGNPVVIVGLATTFGTMGAALFTWLAKRREINVQAPKVAAETRSISAAADSVVVTTVKDLLELEQKMGDRVQAQFASLTRQYDDLHQLHQRDIADLRATHERQIEALRAQLAVAQSHGNACDELLASTRREVEGLKAAVELNSRDTAANARDIAATQRDNAANEREHAAASPLEVIAKVELVSAPNPPSPPAEE